MRSKLLACVVAIASVAMGQNYKMSVEKLIAFVQSSQRIITEEKTMTDKQLADSLNKVVLTDKLEPSVIESLQGLGIGPLTAKALEKLRVASQSLTSTTKMVLPDDPIPPPSSLEQGAILDDVRKYVESYDKSLPDFICTEVEHRQVAPRAGGKYSRYASSGEPSYQEQDIVVSRLSYFNQKEDKKVMTVNSRPTNLEYGHIGGNQSRGDFAERLKMVFERKSQAHFEFNRWATLRGRLTLVFDLRVARDNSDFSVGIEDLGLSTIMGYHGELFVDADTHQVTRLKLFGEIPPGFPLTRVQSQLDYDYTEIGPRMYLLPLYGEVNLDGADVYGRNLLEFRFYRKYSAESEINYDIPANIGALPDSKLQETPAVNCTDAKNKENAACKK